MWSFFLSLLLNDALMRPFVICGASKPKQSTQSFAAQDEEFQLEGLYINTPTHAYPSPHTQAQSMELDQWDESDCLGYWKTFMHNKCRMK